MVGKKQELVLRMAFKHPTKIVDWRTAKTIFGSDLMTRTSLMGLISSGYLKHIGAGVFQLTLLGEKEVSG